MDLNTVQLIQRCPSPPFLPLFFSLAGWALLQAWIHLIGANFRAHVLVAVPGLILTLWSAFPFSGCHDNAAEQKDTPAQQSRGAALTGALLLLALGAVLGNLTAKGSLFLLCVGAMALNFVPWGRLPLEQRHPAVPCALTACGFAAAILAAHQSVSVMFLPLATWAFWLCTCVGLILRAETARRDKRGAAAKRSAIEADSRPATCET